MSHTTEVEHIKHPDSYIKHINNLVKEQLYTIVIEGQRLDVISVLNADNREVFLLKYKEQHKGFHPTQSRAEAMKEWEDIENNKE